MHSYLLSCLNKSVQIVKKACIWSIPTCPVDSLSLCSSFVHCSQICSFCLHGWNQLNSFKNCLSTKKTPNCLSIICVLHIRVLRTQKNKKNLHTSICYTSYILWSTFPFAYMQISCSNSKFLNISPI